MSNPRREKIVKKAVEDAASMVLGWYPGTDVPVNHFYNGPVEPIYGQDWSLIAKAEKTPVETLRFMAQSLENAYRDQEYMIARMADLRKEIEYLRSQKVVNTHFGPIG